MATDSEINNQQYTFIVADDHPLFRSALCHTIAQTYPQARLYEVEDMHTLQLQVTESSNCDLLLFGLHMPGAFGFNGLIFLTSQYPGLPVLTVSANEDPEVMRRAIECGARGFLPKSTPITAIRKMLRQVLAGGVWLPEGFPYRLAEPSRGSAKVADKISRLTPQQFRVATMLAEGLLNKQIAYAMDVTEATVKAHLTALFRKLNVKSRTQAVLALSSLDLEPPGQFPRSSDVTLANYGSRR